jgi:hypothetical protein
MHDRSLGSYGVDAATAAYANPKVYPARKRLATAEIQPPSAVVDRISIAKPENISYVVRRDIVSVGKNDFKPLNSKEHPL